MNYLFIKFFGLGIDCFWSRYRSWSPKNYWVSVSLSVSTFVVSITSLVRGNGFYLSAEKSFLKIKLNLSGTNCIKNFSLVAKYFFIRNK